ncbi:MAG TPA: 30S ribosomal protein S9 [Candidatus Latescibacteria bacterium]|jgi:small subunit ribosomal protein S9|nr:MAG: 30S ribosomal protein S9 [Candidatus Latescibacteria bacterium ADurb.Bin168]HOM58103.1 30S ribosomal protein S9 [Candidatus Latescibacterota bacterium]HOT37245.1 30S ribosomal protein S9 [Candidatus Latescibacterota bacterium]HPC45720.1 30S ribosomal protein S9 [Candidatus Latescibacterota bacterium]HPU85977.1 30S ribosomal protein S9 [Candidatus Latescibacterota bacterium]
MESSVKSMTGRRKEATAMVRMMPGSGQITVNGRPVAEYFARPTLVMMIEQPLKLTDTLGSLDISANCKGGGLSGQAGALRLGIARALVNENPDLRPTLKAAGLLTRDPRMVERKKYGQPGARKRFQFSKR